MKRFAGLTLALALLLLLPGEAAAQGRGSPYTPSALKTLDVGLVRPVMLVVSIAANGFFLGTLPLTFATGVSEQSAYLFVVAPWRFTAARFPGEFETYVDGGTAFGGGARY
jgi:hypothetical protein